MSDTIDPKTGTLGVIVVVEAAYGSAVPGAKPPLTKGMFVEVSIAGHPVTGLAVPRCALSHTTRGGPMPTVWNLPQSSHANWGMGRKAPFFRGERLCILTTFYPTKLVS